MGREDRGKVQKGRAREKSIKEPEWSEVSRGEKDGAEKQSGGKKKHVFARASTWGIVYSDLSPLATHLDP